MQAWLISSDGVYKFIAYSNTETLKYDMAVEKLVPHRPGPTRAVYSKDGQYLISAGSDGVVRRFKVDSGDEPLTLDPLHDDNITGVAVSNDHVVTCSEDATVSLLSIKGGDPTKICRCTLPIRDIAFSPDGEWVAIASEYVMTRFD